MQFLSGLTFFCITSINSINYVTWKVEPFFFWFNFISFTRCTASSKMVHNGLYSTMKNNTIPLFCFFTQVFLYVFTNTQNVRLEVDAFPFFCNIWFYLWMMFIFFCWFPRLLMQFLIPCNFLWDDFFTVPTCTIQEFKIFPETLLQVFVQQKQKKVYLNNFSVLCLCTKLF